MLGPQELVKFVSMSAMLESFMHVRLIGGLSARMILSFTNSQFPPPLRYVGLAEELPESLQGCAFDPLSDRFCDLVSRFDYFWVPGALPCLA